MVGAMAAAAGSVRRPPRPRNGWVPRRGIYAIALLLVCLDLAPKSLRAGYRDGRAEGPDLHAVLEGRLASGRFLELPVMESGRIAADAGRYAPTRDAPSVGGPSVAYAPRSYAYQAAMIDSVAGALNSGKPLAAPLVDLLAYHNVRYLVVSSGGKAVAPPVAPGEGVAEEPSIPALRIDAAAPIAVLPAQAASFEPPPAIPPGGLSPETSRRLVREQIDWLAEVRPRPVREARAVVLPNRTVIEIPDLGAAVVRVARNHYPNTVVLLDGSPWPWRPGPCGGIQLSLVAGPHRIEIRGTEDRVRHAGRVGQWILFGLLFLVAIGPHRR